MKPFMKALKEVIAEFWRASKKHPPYPSAHHGLGVIDEEFHELKLEIYKQKMDRKSARMEACQLAVTAIRFMLDVCEGE